MSKRTERDASMIERIEQGLAKRAETKERRKETLRVPFPIFTQKEWDFLEANIETIVTEEFSGPLCKSTNFTIHAWSTFYSTDEENLNAVSDAFKNTAYYNWLRKYLDLMRYHGDMSLYMCAWMTNQISKFLYEFCTRWNKTHAHFVFSLIENNSFSIRVTRDTK